MKKILLTLSLLTCLYSCMSAQQIIVGTGTGPSLFSPISMIRNYSVYEIIYLASDINANGPINRLGFQRLDGTDTTPADSVTLYFKHTSLGSLVDADYSDTGYTMVYSGSFPNDSGAGWREVNLQDPFAYNGTDNLMVLVVKHYQTAVANTPIGVRWLYTNSGAVDYARRYYGPDSITSATELEVTNFASNVRLTFSTVGVREIGEQQLLVYPNPSGVDLTVHLPENSGASKIILVDYSGKMVYEKSIKNNFEEINETLNVSDLSGGIYILKVSGDNISYQERIVVQK